MNDKLEQLEISVEETRKQLEEKLRVKVYSYIITVKEDDYAIIYLKEPPRLTKMRVMDLLATGQGISSAGDLLLTTSLIPEVSDPRIQSSAPEWDALYLTTITNIIEMIQVYSDILKKK